MLCWGAYEGACESLGETTLALGNFDTKSMFLIVLGVNHSFIFGSSLIISLGIGMGNELRERRSIAYGL
jgi:hypothetical protein